MASLILIKSPGGLASGQAFPLGTGGAVIGREEGCEIVIPNNAVSRRHAAIVANGGSFVLEDLKSRNRTFLNNREITAPATLRNDDRIKICDYLFRFQDARPLGPAPLPREFTPAGPPPEEDAAEGDGSLVSTVHRSLGRGDAQQFLEVQPTEKLRALLDISVALARTLELEPLMGQIADTLFGVFRQADRCFVLLTDEAGRVIPKAVKSRRGGDGEARFSRTIVRTCLESMKSYLSEDASSDANLGAAQSIAEFRIRSVMCVPLATADGRPLGAIQLDTQDYGKKFREEDLKLLTIVANFASVAVEKAQVHAALLSREKQQHEIEIAKKVQLGFLPQTVPAVPGYEFFAYYSAAQTVGGDYYDFIPLPGGRIAVVIGDVAGKGVPASLLMAKLSAEARYAMLTQPDPARAVTLLNEQIVRGGIGDRFITFAALVLEPDEHRVTVVNAGHINPFRVRCPGGTLAEAITDADSGLPLGLMSGYAYTAVPLELAAGESLLVFTDGVTDATGATGAMFGFDGVTRATSDTELGELGPRGVGERLVHAVRHHAGNRPQADDIAIVSFGRPIADSPTTHSGPASGAYRPAE
jgi:sigma-B regulation protein RsbU (phosphoserine phosphatase)